MKKLRLTILLLLAAAMCATAVFAETLPDAAGYEALNSARDLRKVLERHTSMLSVSQVFFQDEVVGTQYRYADADCLRMLSSDGVGYLDTADLSVMASDSFPGGYCTYIADTEETYRTWYERDTVDFAAMAAEDETLYATEIKDGLFVACVELKGAETVQERIESLADSYGGYPYREGMSLLYRRVFDPVTSDLLSEEEWIVEADGTEYLLSRDTCMYDESFDYAREGCPLYDYFHADGNTRTVSVTYRPGTEGEVIRECAIPQGTGFLIYRGGQGVQEFFTDPECTQPFTGSEGNTDLYLYVKEDE